MKKTARRGLSLLLAVVMVLSATAVITVPVGAAATLYWPVPGHTSYSNYHPNKTTAIDISDGSISGAPVIAAMGGTVRESYDCARNHYGDYSCYCRGNGNGLIILGDDGRYYNYAHMQAGSIPGDVYPVGSYVPAGKKIGCVGSTGNSSGPHLHFQIFNSIATQNTGPSPANEKYIYSTPSPTPSASVLTISGVKYPTYKTTGQPFEVFGVISSPNLITLGEALVYSTSGQYMFGIGTYTENGRYTYNLNDFDSQMRFASLPAGNYLYIVKAWDSAGYEVYMEFPFTVGPGATASATSPAVKGKHNCTACGTWNSGTVTVSPTCTDKGTRTYACTVCGDKKTESIAAKGHSTEYVEAREATPFADGNIAHYRCTHCGRLFADANASSELSAQDVVLKYVAPKPDPVLTPVTIKAPVVEVVAGSSVANITITAENIPAGGLRAALFEVRCSGLTILSYSTADGISGTNEFNPEEIHTGNIKWDWCGKPADTITRNGTALINLTVAIPDTAKAGDRYEITVIPDDDPANFLDINENALGGVGTNGAILVVDSLSQTVDPGDANGDGRVNAKDITAVMKAILGQKPAQYYEAAADVTGDGRVNALDITAIMKMILK